jgi:hypothetical protein
MLDVFFCTMPLSDERKRIAEKMLEWWRDVPMCHVHIVTPESIGSNAKDFNLKRRMFADQTTEWAYVLTDDDCELNDEKMVWKALGLLEKYTDFAILSALPDNATINPWTPEIYPPFANQEVQEHVSVGGIRFCRTGCMDRGWPIVSSAGYDAAHCQRLRECGWRSGYANQVRMFHHGEGKSDLWRESLSQVPKAV